MPKKIPREKRRNKATLTNLYRLNSSFTSKAVGLSRLNSSFYSTKLIILISKPSKLSAKQILDATNI